LTTQTEHSPFPSDETLAAYIDGHLDEATRKQVVEHIADCPECFEVVQVNQEMPAAPVVKNVVHWPRTPIVGLAAAAVVGAVLLLTPLRERILPHDDLRALAKVAPPTRKIYGRLSGFPYQLLHVPRGGEDKSGDDHSDDHETLAFQIAAGDAQKRAMEHPNARTLHAEGVAYLGLGHINDAVKTLEAAKNASSNPGPQLLSDLAAAYLASGKYDAALKTANEAWSKAQTPEIAWNRAVAAQYIEPRAKYHDEAIAAWNDYFRFKDSPKWREEARSHFETVRTEFLQDPPK
jgi:tetratricopeptide (TPR) repeat protein